MRFAGKHVVVAGSGASAQNVLVALARLAEWSPARERPGSCDAASSATRSEVARTTSSSSAARSGNVL